MLNQVILVGRVKELKDNKLTLAIPQSIKNEKGEYETDIIHVTFPTQSNISKNVNEYCHKGDIVGIKGKVGTHNQIIAEKVTFLTSNRGEK